MDKDKFDIDSLESFEAQGIRIYMEPGLKFLRDTVNLWYEEGFSYSRLRVDAIRPASNN